MARSEAANQQNPRKAILAGRFEGLNEATTLGALLSFVLTRGDANSVAEELLARFGSLSGILMASPRELRRVHGVGDAAAALIKLVGWIRVSASGTPAEERSLRTDGAVNVPAEPARPISAYN